MSRITLLTLAVALLSGSLQAQVTQPAPGPSAQTSQQTAASSSAPRTITLQDALNLARANEPTFRAAVTAYGLAHEDKVQARATLLPSVNYTTEYLYTQGNGTPTGVFIANNTVHEYVAQGNGHEALSLADLADYRRATAAEALARARQEVAARGLVVVVVQNFYGLIVAQRAYANAQQAATESQRFFTITQQLERGGEVAHSDVIRAQIQNNSVQHDFQEARLAMDKARLNLAVLLFRNFDDNFTAVDDMELAPPLPAFDQAQQMAAKNNPELRAAFAAVQVAGHELQAAWAGHLPTLAFDVWYGIDAPHFATYEPDGVRNLGYSAAATLTLPVWNWGATQSKVKQAQLRQRQAEVELSAAQRGAIADLRNFYAEAQTSRVELDTLRQSADLAAESLRLTTLRYQAGEATALEVVDAQNTLVQTRNAFAQGEARYRVAVATLQTVTGTF